MIFLHLTRVYDKYITFTSRLTLNFNNMSSLVSDRSDHNAAVTSPQ